MEELFIGNTVILLFWVFISLIVDINEKYKKIVLMYLVTYIANILNIVPTLQSYTILLIALFLEIEFLNDTFKKQIINSIFDEIIDFLYTMISQYALFSFSLSLLLSSDLVKNEVFKEVSIIAPVLSLTMLYFSCKNASSEEFKTATFSEIKCKMDSIENYRGFQREEKYIRGPYCVLGIEDNSFYLRGERYTFLNSYYLQKYYLWKFMNMIKRFCRASQKKNSVKKFVRGYSTIEMQLLRTLAIQNGYNCIFRRKVYEIIYSRLFWKNLRLYYKKCNCDTDQFKDYILYLYLRTAQCLNRGQEKQLEKVIRTRKEVETYSNEELFVLTLCFSGKIKRDNVLEIYEDIIEEYELDLKELKRLIKELNE